MLEQLQQRFDENTRERLQEMLGLLAACEAGSLPAIDELFRHFHALAGLGATLGRPAISDLAAVGEREAKKLRLGSKLPSAEQRRHWRHLIDAMQSAIDAAAAPRQALVARTSQASFELLVVSGDADLRNTLDGMLGTEGYSVRVCRGAEEAREAMAAHLPHAVIADLQLPDGTGYDVVRDFRESPETEQLLAVIATAGGWAVDRVELIRCGADACFELPRDGKAFMRRVGIAYQTQNLAARILIVEDEPDQVAILSSILQSAGYETRSCGTASEVESAVMSFDPDLVLLDVHLGGGSNGHDVARLLRQDERHATTPVIFVTTEAGMESVLGTIRAGGDDHLVKPVQPAMLLTVVSARLQRAHLLRALVDRDGLTGLLTHGAFRQQLDRAVSPERRGQDARSALVMVDVDHFKSVNDRFGHRTGDRVLSSLGAFLRRKVRQSDAIARYGGEEFTLLLRDLTEADAVRLVNGLLQEFAAVEHQTPEQPIRVTFSAGVAVLDAIPSGRAEDWIEAADRALYEAKRTGRARVVSASALKARTAA